jgi:uncharacterized protein YhaN
MRLRRLDLTRYGHFTDKSIDLPAAEVDFHIVYGPNEAGKSTALSAIEDLLFGIPARSPYNFLHDNSAMRIGALLESGSSILDVIRRKGNKDTLLGSDESPVAGGDGVLGPFLAGADQPFFTRMFSLDHTRLHEGGKNILEAKDDIGQMLFSAGAGIGGLRDRLNDLTKEAEELWTPRRAGHRKFYQADDKLKAAEKLLREHTLSEKQWRELKRDLEAAETKHDEVAEALRKASAERNRLSRIRRIYRDVRRKQELDLEISELNGTASLPVDAKDILEAADRKVAAASVRLETLTGQLEQATQELTALTFDEALLRRAKDVLQLDERRIEIRSERADLPKREAELNAAEQALRALASELGWKEGAIEGLIERIPPRTRISVIRALLGERGELVSNRTNSTLALEDAERDLAEVQQQLEDIGNSPDVSSLAATIKAVREQGDISVRIRAVAKDEADAQARVERLLASLHPSIFGEKEATTMRTPARALMQNHRDLVQDWERRLRESQQDIASLERTLVEARESYENAARDEHAVTAGELAEVRARRDTIWQLIKLKHIQNVPIPDEELAAFSDDIADLAGVFEPAIGNADALADSRFDNAAAVGQLAGLADEIVKQESRLARGKEDQKLLAVEGENLAADWQSLWESAPINPADPDKMLEWLDRRDEILEAVSAREAAATALEGQRAEERGAKEQVLTALTALGIDQTALKKDTLNVMLEKAADQQRRHDTQAQERDRLQSDLKDTETKVAARQRELNRAEEAWSAWQVKWTTELKGLGLAVDLDPAAVEAQIDVIDQMRQHAKDINTLRHDRIDKINRDITDFNDVVAELVGAVATDLKDAPAEEAVLKLDARLSEAERLKDLQADRQQTILTLEKDIETLDEKRREASVSVQHLKDDASVETDEALKSAIARSDLLRGLQASLADVAEKLATDGDGLSFDMLAQDCAEIDIDQTAALEDSLADEADELQKRLSDTAEQRSQARDAFQAVGGDDAAAKAAADKQEALAEMKEVAERYVRVRTSALLLQWSIDRYRREKQAPLLKRAGELFATLCGGSFVGLSVIFDDQDNAQLTGVRPNGEKVSASGMSTGSADQLYLALRVASVEDYQTRADTLPFVTDDLFVNFDDDRAAAGFQVLTALSQKTQVLFFTHHQHLVNIARGALGASVHVINLQTDEAMDAPSRPLAEQA